MCNFFAAIAFRDGSIYADPEHTDSHLDLIETLGLDDSRPPQARNWLRVEFIPKRRLDDLDFFTLRPDCPQEDELPTWWEEREEQIRNACRSAIKAMVITDTRELLLGGCWILAGKAKVATARNCRIIAMHDSSYVGCMWDSVRVGWMRDSARVGDMLDNSFICEMRDSASVGKMHNHTCISHTHNDSSIGEMCDSTHIDRMHGDSRVGEMHDRARVGCQR